MTYNLDLNRLSLTDYRERLKNQNLLPGRRILWLDIDANFSKIAGQGIENVAQLGKALSSPTKLTAFAQKAGMQEEYLNILRREAGSMEQKPIQLSDFKGTDEPRLQALSKQGIKTSKDYWEKQPLRDELYCLCDLVRINGVGVAAARAFFEAGYVCLTDVAQANAKEMLRRVTDANNEKHYYNAVLGEKDIQFCIDYAKLLKLFSE